MQTVQTFEAALEALVAAGVELVEFDMGLLTAEGAEIEAELLLAYEMPREVSRSVHLLHRRFKMGHFSCAAECILTFATSCCLLRGTECDS